MEGDTVPPNYYNVANLIAGLQEYREVGVLLIGQEEISRCLNDSLQATVDSDDPQDECPHDLITLHAGTCDRCGAFFVRPIHHGPHV